MSLNANKSKNTTGSMFEPVEPGTYPARLVQVIDLGKQPQPPYQGKDKPPAYKVAFTYELVDEFMKDEDGQDDESKPRWITEDMPLYTLDNDRAKSTTRYNALDPEGKLDGDWSALLDTPCMVTIVHNAGKKRVYENIASVSAMRAKEAAKCPELVNEVVSFDMDAPDLEDFFKIPKWLQDRIKNSLEFKNSELDKLLGANADSNPPKDEEDDDEIPY